MKKMEIAVLSNVPNAVVVQLPGRRYPGMVIQGDSLSNLYSIAREAGRLLDQEHGDTDRDDEEDDAGDLIGELVELLSVYLMEYESVLATYQIDLPYSGPLVLDAQSGSKDPSE